MKNKDIAILVEKVQAGNEEAFEALYHEIWPIIYYLIFTDIGNKEAAKDIAQEAILLVYRDIKNLRNPLAFNEWVRRLVINQSTRYIQKKSKENNMEFFDASIEVDIGNTPEENVIKKEQTQWLFEAIADLPREQRQSVFLYYYDYRSITEIAAILETSEAAVYKKLQRARKTIKQKATTDQRGMTELASFSYIAPLIHAHAQTLYSSEAYAAILQTVQEEAVLATVQPVSSATTLGKAKSASITKIVGVIGISVSTLIATWSGVAVYNSRQAPPQKIVEPNKPIQQESTPEPQLPEPSLTGLEALLGVEDANLLRSWREISTVNKDAELLDLANRHQINLNENFHDRAGDNSYYTIFSLNRDGVQLIICEKYNVESGEWSARYSLEPVPIELPHGEQIIGFYNQH